MDLHLHVGGRGEREARGPARHAAPNLLKLLGVPPIQRIGDTQQGAQAADQIPSDQNGSIPGFRLRGRIIPQLKVHTVAGLWEISNVAPGASWLNFLLFDTFQMSDVAASDTRFTPAEPKGQRHGGRCALRPILARPRLL